MFVCARVGIREKEKTRDETTMKGINEGTACRWRHKLQAIAVPSSKPSSSFVLVLRGDKHPEYFFSIGPSNGVEKLHLLRSVLAPRFVRHDRNYFSHKSDKFVYSLIRFYRPLFFFLLSNHYEHIRRSIFERKWFKRLNVKLLKYNIRYSAIEVFICLFIFPFSFERTSIIHRWSS